MTFQFRRVCAVGFVLAGLGAGGSGTAHAEGPAVDAGAARQIAQDYFALRAAAVVTAPSGADAGAPALDALPATPALVDRLTADLDVLEGRRATLSELREEYTAAATDVEVGAVRATQDGAVARVTETTTLTYARIRGDEPPVTAYELEHTLTYVREGSRLVLASDEVDPQGMLPITAVSSRAAAGSATEAPRAELEAPAAADPLPHGSATDCGQAGACDASDEAAADMTVADSNTAATPSPVTSKPNPSVPDQDFELIPPMNRSGAAPAGMNYGAVINYAYRHWSSYNGAYRSFGNDCTNFVSQALRAGGWPMDYGWYRGDGNWWYNSSNQTFTWAGAENWSRFAPKRTTYLGNTYQLLPSDVMTMDFNRDNHMDHAMVVTRKTSSMPYFTYHTNNTLDRSMQSIYSQYSSSWYYAFRT